MARTTALALAAGTLIASQASAITVGFTNISNNSGLAAALAPQFSLEITDAGSGVVSFLFTNEIGIQSSICDIYLDNGSASTSTLTSISDLIESDGVSFSPGASPGNLPGGNAPAVGFSTTQGLSADSDSPVSMNGIDSALESLDMRLTLRAGRTFADLLGDLQTGELRIGLHVQAIGDNGESDGFVSGPPGGPIIPLPSAAGMGGVALLGLAARRRRTA